MKDNRVAKADSREHELEQFVDWKGEGVSLAVWGKHLDPEPSWEVGYQLTKLPRVAK